LKNQIPDAGFTPMANESNLPGESLLIVRDDTELPEEILEIGQNGEDHTEHHHGVEDSAECKNSYDRARKDELDPHPFEIIVWQNIEHNMASEPQQRRCIYIRRKGTGERASRDVGKKAQGETSTRLSIDLLRLVDEHDRDIVLDREAQAARTADQRRIPFIEFHLFLADGTRKNIEKLFLNHSLVPSP
jgi:hypothetical protein